MKVKRMLGCLVLGVVTAVGGSAAAGEAISRDGNWLLAQCKDGPTEDWKTCVGYLQGIDDMHDIATTGSGDTFPRFYSIPDTATWGQLKLVVVKYFEDHPERLHLPAASSVLLAFRSAFPYPVDTKRSDKPK